MQSTTAYHSDRKEGKKFQIQNHEITFNLLIIVSSESIDIDKPWINRFASILA